MIIVSQDGQSMYDICMQGYQTLDNMVKLCTDNDILNLNYAPPEPTEFTLDDTFISGIINRKVYATNYEETGETAYVTEDESEYYVSTSGEIYIAS